MTRRQELDPAYGYASEQIAAELKRRIVEPETVPPELRLYAGAYLPSINQMHRDYGVARNTAQRVYRLLERDDLIEVQPSVGAKVIYRP